MHNKTIQIQDKEFELYIPYEKIDEAVQNIADRLNRDYKEKVDRIEGEAVLGVELKRFRLFPEVRF